MAEHSYSFEELVALWQEWLEHDDDLYWDHDHHREKVTLDGLVLPFPEWLKRRTAKNG